MSKRVFVTGASGFVGRRLTEVLVARGDDVSGCGPEDAMPADLQVSNWHSADVREVEGLRSAVASARPDWVVHLAGQASAGKSFGAPTETFRINALGTWNLLEAVREGAPAARVLAIGSGEVYGPQPAGSHVAEDAPFHPVSPYALSKAAADALADAHGSGHGLDVVRTRSFSHIGPGQAPTFAIPSWARQIAAIEKSEHEPVLAVGNLEVTRDIAHIDDVVDAYIALLERGRTGGVYNVCSGRGVRLSEVVEMLTALSDSDIEIRVDPDRVRPADVEYLVGDASRLRDHTNWTSRRTLEKALEAVLARWRSN